MISIQSSGFEADGFPRRAICIPFTNLSWFDLIKDLSCEQLANLSNPKRTAHPEKLFLPNGTDTKVELAQWPSLVAFHNNSPSVEVVFD